MTGNTVLKSDNEVKLIFEAKSCNEGLARVVVAAFCADKNPTLEEMSDIKTAISEAVTNSIIHGYEEGEGKVILRCKMENQLLTVEVEDEGVGIENIEQAMEPLYTSKPDLDRSGMGFSFMEAFMDEVEVESNVGVGTKVTMKKEIGSSPWILDMEEIDE